MTQGPLRFTVGCSVNYKCDHCGSAYRFSSDIETHHPPTPERYREAAAKRAATRSFCYRTEPRECPNCASVPPDGAYDSRLRVLFFTAILGGLAGILIGVAAPPWLTAHGVSELPPSQAEATFVVELIVHWMWISFFAALTLWLTVSSVRRRGKQRLHRDHIRVETLGKISTGKTTLTPKESSPWIGIFMLVVGCVSFTTSEAIRVAFGWEWNDLLPVSRVAPGTVYSFDENERMVAYDQWEIEVSAKILNAAELGLGDSKLSATIPVSDETESFGAELLTANVEIPNNSKLQGKKLMVETVWTLVSPEDTQEAGERQIRRTAPIYVGTHQKAMAYFSLKLGSLFLGGIVIGLGWWSLFRRNQMIRPEPLVDTKVKAR